MRNHLLLAALTALAAAACSPMPMEVDAGMMIEACPAATGTVVTHQNDVMADETWAGDGSLHKVAFDVTIRPGATLTLGECAKVQIIPGRSIIVAGDVATSRPAKLVAAGKLGRRVTLERFDASAAFADLRTMNEQSFIDLSYTTVSGGGGGSTIGNPMIVARSTATFTELYKTIRLIGVVLDGSAGQGLRFESATAFTDDSSDILITHSGGQGVGAIQAGPYALTTFPRTLVIRDNALDEIDVKAGTLAVERDVTLKNLGVPYHFIFDYVRVHSQTASPTLTIEKGNRLRFDASIQVGWANPPGNDFRPGKIIAVGGTGANEQIVFTGAKSAPAAGDWAGIHLMNAPGSRLENVIIEKAGGPNGISSANCRAAMTNDNAALFIGGKDIPYLPNATDFVNVTVNDSAGHGINPMWSTSDFGPNLTGAFTFGTIAGCRQVKNGRPQGCGNMEGCLVQ